MNISCIAADVKDVTQYSEHCCECANCTLKVWSNYWLTRWPVTPDPETRDKFWWLVEAIQNIQSKIAF